MCVGVWNCKCVRVWFEVKVALYVCVEECECVCTGACFEVRWRYKCLGVWRGVNVCVWVCVNRCDEGACV